MDNHISATQLADILGMTKGAIYLIMHPEKKYANRLKKAEREERTPGKKNFVQYQDEHDKVNFTKQDNSRLVKIDIDKFLNEHKMFDFQFINEREGKSFLERLKSISVKKVDDYPEYLTTYEVKELTGMERHTLNRLRKLGLIRYIQTENPKPNKTGTNQVVYGYLKKSILEYIQSKGIKINYINRVEMKFIKQFYSPKEAVNFVNKTINTNYDTSAVYRRIYKHKIPAIRVGTLIKVPILELQELNLRSIFKK